jgi:hypothetical protein
MVFGDPFPSGVLVNIPYAFLLSPLAAKCGAHLILPDLIKLIVLRGEYKLRSYALCGLPHLPVTPSLFVPNILLRTLFPNSLSLCSPINVRDHVSRPYRTTVKIKSLVYFNLYNFRQQTRRQKVLDRMVASRFNFLLI